MEEAASQRYGFARQVLILKAATFFLREDSDSLFQAQTLQDAYIYIYKNICIYICMCVYRIKCAFVNMVCIYVSHAHD